MDITALLNGLTPGTDNKVKAPETGENSFSLVLAAASGENAEATTKLLVDSLTDTREQLITEAAQTLSAPVSVQDFQTKEINESEEQLSELAAAVDLPVTTLVNGSPWGTSTVVPVNNPQTGQPTVDFSTDVAPGHTLFQQPSTELSAVSLQSSEGSPASTPAIQHKLRAAQAVSVPNSGAHFSDAKFTAESGARFASDTTGSLLPTAEIAGRSVPGVSETTTAPAAMTGQSETRAMTPTLLTASGNNLTYASQAATDYTMHTHVSSTALNQVTGEATSLGTGVGSMLNSSTQPGPIAASMNLQSPLTSGLWGRELEQQLVGLIQRGGNSMELQLNPRELGPLSVSLTLEDQNAKLQFFSAHTVVRSAVEQAIPQLRDALAQQGITLAEASVGEQQQRQREDSTQRAPHQSISGSNNNDSVLETAVVSASPTAESTGIYHGGVDLYA